MIKSQGQETTKIFEIILSSFFESPVSLPHYLPPIKSDLSAFLLKHNFLSSFILFSFFPKYCINVIFCYSTGF
jgi:hypothetical protein